MIMAWTKVWACHVKLHIVIGQSAAIFKHSHNAKDQQAPILDQMIFMTLDASGNFIAPSIRSAMPCTIASSSTTLGILGYHFDRYSLVNQT